MIPPLQRDPRYRSLDLWRGLFCLLVVVEHAGVALWPGMGEGSGLEGALRYGFVWFLQRNLGAPLFFVVSGYCIAASLDASRRRGRSSALFLVRRFWRIFPPYWAALLACFAVVAGLDAAGLDRWHRGMFALELDSPGALNRAQWVGNLTLTETWRPLVWGGGMPSIFTRVAWSLCYQEQFYLVCFLALTLAPRRLHAALAWATAAILAVQVALWDIGSDHRIAGMFPQLWHEFAVGLAVFWRLNVADTRARRLGLDLALAGLLLLAIYHEMATTIAASALGLALIALRRFDDRLDALGRMGPLRSLGRMSYSLYLIHLPVCVVATAALTEWGLTSYAARAWVVVPAATLASLLVGRAFHRLVDAHFHALPAWQFPTIGWRRAALAGR